MMHQYCKVTCSKTQIFFCKVTYNNVKVLLANVFSTFVKDSKIETIGNFHVENVVFLCFNMLNT